MEIQFHSTEVKEMFERLQALGLEPETKNKGIHIFFSFEHWRFDLWTTTSKLHITNRRSGMKKSYSNASTIESVLNWYFG